jgi:hypothetical protein
MLACMASLAMAAAPPPELGAVRWGRDYPAALEESARTGRPLLVLFTEVPGCSTVNGYAQSVLSDPLVVDASELFVRVAIFNNLDGADRTVLDRWREPAWNNPVLRIIDGRERELVARVTHDSGAEGLLAAMAKALGQKAPAWLQAAASDEGAVRATFAMGCFWEGEAALGALPEVRSTHPGYASGREVVQLTADSPQALERIAAQARTRGYAAVDGTVRISERDDKYHLQGTRFEKLNLRPGQKMRINSAVASGGDPLQWLSPSQLRANPNP